MKLPDKHQAVMPYLILDGVAGFIEFASHVFGAVELVRHNADNNRIMHAEISINGSTIMMGDSSEQWKSRPASLYIYNEDVDRTYEKALKKGAKSVMEPRDQSYGRTCGVEDRYGNVWWITSPPK